MRQATDEARTTVSQMIFIALLLLSLVAFYLGSKKAVRVAGGQGKLKDLHSRPTYYGALIAFWCFIPAFIVFSGWQLFETEIITKMVVAELPQEMQELPHERLVLIVNDIKNTVSGNIVSDQENPVIIKAAKQFSHLQTISDYSLAVAALCLVMLGGMVGWRKISPKYRARNDVENVLKVVLIVCSTIAIFTTVGIVLSVLFEAIRFFKVVPITDFLFGLEWSPQMAIRKDQVGSSGAFGAVPVFTGTFLISGIAMAVAIPIGLMSAIYMSEYASKKFRSITKPMMEILAGIPTVVYGFFAALMVAPVIRDGGGMIGLEIASESALAAGLVMGIMIIPFVSSLSDDAINAVPQSLREGSYGLGAMKSETIRKVVLPAALPGIVGGILLAVSRAIGETMIVVMAAGLSANLTANPFAAVTTVTVQIVTLLIGDHEFDSPKTLAAFALGLVLFIMTLILNVIALIVVRKYREQYE